MIQTDLYRNADREGSDYQNIKIQADKARKMGKLFLLEGEHISGVPVGSSRRLETNDKSTKANEETAATAFSYEDNNNNLA